MARDAAQDREIKTSLMSSGSLSPRVEAVHAVVEKVDAHRMTFDSGNPRKILILSDCL